jgi:hypothetical protein
MGPAGAVGAPASRPWRVGGEGPQREQGASRRPGQALLGKTLPLSGKTFPFSFHGAFPWPRGYWPVSKPSGRI